MAYANAGQKGSLANTGKRSLSIQKKLWAAVSVILALMVLVNWVV